MIKKEKKIQQTRFLFCLFASAVLIAICSCSSPFYPFNNAADANCFFTVGKSMMNGVIPYRDLYEQKGPLLYFLYGLAYLISNNTFFGVYLLETAALAAFMLSIIRIAELYADHTPYWVPAAIGAVCAASYSFVLGGCSVEELALPVLSWSIYHMLTLLRSTQKGVPHTFGLPVVLLNGFFAGCIFWMKYTLNGFYIGWIAIIFILQLKNSGFLPALKTAVSFILGVLAATLPWMCYFYFNHALSDLWQVYFYNNIFLYSPVSGDLLTAFYRDFINFLRGMYKNPWYSIPVAAGLLWILLVPRKRVPITEKNGIIITFVLLAAGIYVGGKAYAYYPLILGVYTVFGVIPFVLLINMTVKRRKGAIKHFEPVCSAVFVVLIGIYAFCFSPNTYFFGMDKDVMIQHNFSDIMHELDDKPTLLNYGFMDSGFYTAANIVPTVKYFSTLNIMYASISEAQNGYLQSGCVEFVVTENAELDLVNFNKYRLICSDVFHSKSYSSIYYLYQRIVPLL